MGGHFKTVSHGHFARFLHSDQQFERIVTILLDDDKNIYEWQEYHIWRIFINHSYKSDLLLNKARKNLIERATNIPIVGGSVLYLCALGDGNDRKQIADNFNNLNSFFTQRIALIGIKDLDYPTIIKGSVENYLDHSQKGTYRPLKDKYGGTFNLSPSKLNVKDFYNELPEFIS